MNAQNSKKGERAMGVHDGHRSRVKERFENHGLDNFDDHTVLELLLFYSRPRCDTNPIAHDLIKKFGSFYAVFDAPEEELLQVKGVGENTVRLLKLVLQVSRRYRQSRAENIEILDSAKNIGEYLLPRFIGEYDESVYVICLDSAYRVINCQMMFRGSINSADISIRKIAEHALKYKASNVVIAHNHPSGVAVPSKADIMTTYGIQDVLKGLGIKLLDHVIIADEDFVSLRESGALR